MRRSIISLNLLAPIVALLWLINGHVAAAILSLLVAHALFLIPTLIPTNSWCGPVLTHLNSTSAQNHQVWLTIDDGPHPLDTPILLDLLDQYQAKATFFFIGEKALQHPGLVKLVLQRGHTIGNHTMHHPQYWFWSYLPFQLEREIAQCQKILTDQILTVDQAPQWFRAPAGLKNPFIHTILARHHLQLACWNARGLDGVEQDPEKILHRLLPQIQPGSIILMHEAREDHQGNRLAPQILTAILQHIQQHQLCTILPDIKAAQ